MRPFLLLLSCLLLSPAALAGELKPYHGPALPDFTLQALDGTTHRLSDYRGKVVLLNFWATWCPPCVHEMPSMQRLSKRLAGRPFAVVSVDMGEEPAQVQAFLKRVKVDFPILLDNDGKVLQSWKIYVFPTSFLIDAEGHIRASVHGGLVWDSPAVRQRVEALLPPR